MIRVAEGVCRRHSRDGRGQLVHPIAVLCEDKLKVTGKLLQLMVDNVTDTDKGRFEQDP